MSALTVFITLGMIKYSDNNFHQSAFDCVQMTILHWTNQPGTQEHKEVEM